VDPEAYVDPTAQIIGRVRIGPRVFVGPSAVIRADEANADGEVEAVTIEPECNVQDGVIIHALAGTPVTIRTRTSLAHGAIIHGPCAIGPECFVGFGAVVFKSNVGSGVFVGTRAVVQGVNIPADMFVPPSVALSQDQVGQLRPTSPDEREFMDEVVRTNVRLAEGYLNAARPVHELPND